MASADELRRFATARFLSNGIGSRTGAWDRDVWVDYRDLPDDDFIRISDFAIRPAGELVEREGWHTLGARLGYLNEREPLTDDDRRVLEKVLSLPEHCFGQGGSDLLRDPFCRNRVVTGYGPTFSP